MRIELLVRFRPSIQSLPLLHQGIGPNYESKYVVPVVTDVLRRRVASLSEEEFFSKRIALIDQVMEETREELSGHHIELQSVLIESIELPPNVRIAIENKVEKKHLALAHEYLIEKETKEAERLEIEAGAYSKYNTIIGESIANHPDMLRWKALLATEAISTSDNAKVIVVGNGENGLPVILGGQ